MKLPAGTVLQPGASARHPRRGLARGKQPGDRHRLAHRLAVLELVPQDHLADHAVAGTRPLQHLNRALANGPQVGTRLLGVQQLRVGRAPGGGSRRRRR